MAHISWSPALLITEFVLQNCQGCKRNVLGPYVERDLTGKHWPIELSQLAPRMRDQTLKRVTLCGCYLIETLKPENNSKPETFRIIEPVPNQILHLPYPSGLLWGERG